MTELQVGKQAPLFEMDAVMPDKSFGKVSLKENIQQEKWTVLFFILWTLPLSAQQKLRLFQINMSYLKIWILKLSVFQPIRFIPI